MDDLTSEQLKELSQEVGAAINEVDAALESGEDARQLAVGRLVGELAKRYQELRGGLDEKSREMVERGLGRRVVDLRRAAEQLTRRMPGAKAVSSRDAGSLPFLEQRMPPKPIVPERAAPSEKLSVGGEIESWCGKCKEMREHRIVAMVGSEAKQVICVVCASRHAHKGEPPARARAQTPAPVGIPAQRRTDEAARDKRADEKRALQKELLEAVDPRPFDPKARYKAGEIIVHPEHGRGKIENVLRSSMLVRFLEGLRPVDLS
ncbi:MAG TPA: hypothetical protein VII38_15905 [Polyangia bacterium]